MASLSRFTLRYALRGALVVGIGSVPGPGCGWPAAGSHPSCAAGMAGAGCSASVAEVHGTAIDRGTDNDAASTPVQAVWSYRTVTALSPLDTGSVPPMAHIDAQGSFVLPGVPAGPYWLAFPDEAVTPSGSQTYVWTDARELDLGRLDLVNLVNDSDSKFLPFRITGLAPAQKDDHIDWYITSLGQSGGWGLGTLGAVEASWPMEGIIPLRRYPGDRLVISQWNNSVAGGVRFGAVVRSGSLEAPDETTTSLELALTDAVPQKFGVQVDHAAFVGAFAGLAKPFEAVLTLLMHADANPDHGEVAKQMLRVENLTEGGDPSTRDRSFVDPYPAAWSRRYQLSYRSQTVYPISGTDGVRCDNQVVWSGTASELLPGPVRPRLGMPQAVLIDKNPAMVEQGNVSLTPTIRWLAPAGEAVSFYVLRLVRLVPDNSYAGHYAVAGTFVTSATAAQIPSGVLQVNAEYYLQLTARTGAGTDLSIAPRRASLRAGEGSAQMCSARFQTIHG